VYNLRIGFRNGDLIVREDELADNMFTGKRTAETSSVTASEPEAALPITIFLSLTGGLGEEKIVFAIYGCGAQSSMSHWLCQKIVLTMYWPAYDSPIK
jgi:hypothetical protein